VLHMTIHSMISSDFNFDKIFLFFLISNLDSLESLVDVYRLKNIGLAIQMLRDTSVYTTYILTE
jgi:hypothetical protein